MLGVGEAFEETVRSAKNREGHFPTIDESGKVFMVALAGFTEENSLDGTAGTKGLLDEPHTFNADESGFREQASAKS
jgi:hypothetical protein